MVAGATEGLLRCVVAGSEGGDPSRDETGG